MHFATRQRETRTTDKRKHHTRDTERRNIQRSFANYRMSPKIMSYQIKRACGFKRTRDPYLRSHTHTDMHTRIYMNVSKVNFYSFYFPNMYTRTHGRTWFFIELAIDVSYTYTHTHIKWILHLNYFYPDCYYNYYIACFLICVTVTFHLFTCLWNWGCICGNET